MLLENQKMANNVQFEKWTADQVAEWLRGLDVDDAMIPYMHFFLNSGVDGRKLMLMTHADLEKLNVVKLGHQELILEAIDLLRNLRYGYETENLQSLALQLGCKARSLNGEIRARCGENDRNRANTTHGSDVRPKRLSILILSTVADLIATLKSLVSWMDKAPFSGFHDLCLVRNTIVKLGLELINFCQRESTLPDVEQAISISSSALSDICEKLVVGSPDSPLDPLYVQPASLEMATIRKKQGEELGMHILSSYYGVHVISGIKDMSPADLCGKIEKGDEVIQVNHQTVVGWQLKKLVNTLKEKPKEVVLLLKKRPRHISPYGAMPNKKKQNMMTKHAVQSSTLPKSLKKLRSRDGEPKQLRPSLQEFVNSVPSIGDELSSPKEEINDGNDTDNDVFRSGSESPQFTLPVQTDPKQRRATVSGGSPTHSRPLLVIEDIDAPRPKSFTVTGTVPGVHHEIIINSPSGENLADLHRLATAMEKRQEYKTKSTPPSLEFSVRKPTPKIIEPKDTNTSTVEEDADATPREEDVVFVGVTYPDRMVNAAERLLDSSTDSVPPSESSIESSQTCTSSLESSSHSPPLEESSLSSEKKEDTKKETSDLLSEGATSLHPPPPLIQVTDIQGGAIYQRPPASHMEVATDYDKNAPQLRKIRKLDSFTREAERKGRHVAFGGIDSDKDTDSLHEESQSYICKVVGGVPQKIPVTAGSPGTSPVVRRRPKGVGRTLLNRRVSCKDLGKGDCEGFLFKRRLHGRGPLSSHWDKRWCVIKRYYLYCYHHKESEKAEIVIHLPAFQVSPVDHHDLKTKKFAFKVHNSGTFFIFASDRREDMSKWMNKMGLAAIAYANERPKVVREHGHDHGDKDFSESEDEEPPTVPSQGTSQNQSQGVEQPKGASLMAPAPELRGSQVDLSVMLRRQSERGHNLYGEDKNATRRSVLSREVLDQIQPELNKLKKLQSLERTLKAKETELAELDEVLSTQSPEKFRSIRDQLGGSLQRLNIRETDSD